MARITYNFTAEDAEYAKARERFKEVKKASSSGSLINFDLDRIAGGPVPMPRVTRTPRLTRSGVEEWTDTMEETLFAILPESPVNTMMLTRAMVLNSKCGDA